MRFLLLTTLLLSACGDDTPSTPDASTLDAGTFTGTCPVELTYRSTGATPTVFVGGEWNDFSDSADQLIDDGTGTYRITLDLAPGVHAYKLIVTGDGGDPWRLDPANPYRAYAGGVENSGLRVRDCSRGRFEVLTSAASADGRFDATLRWSSGLGGTGARLAVLGELRSAGMSRMLTPAELTQGVEPEVHLSGLSPGKHTVRLTTATPASDDILLPFWIEARPFEWRDALIYMVMTDRFRNGDPSNDPGDVGASPGAGWHGGDLQGVTQAIRDGWFDQLGVRAIWLTPFNTNPPGVYADADDFHQVAGYHGYWPTEPRQVDPRLGGDAALREMVAEAHAHGIRILMDLVANHVHQDHPYYREHPEWFNSGCICGTGGCDWTARRLDCLFRPYMPDLNWEHREASEQFLADALWWLEEYDLDGFRVDAVKHVVDGAIFNLGTRVRERFETAGTRYFLMGETAMGWDGSAGPTEGGNPENYGTISRYIEPYGLDGQFDFVLYYAAALQFLGDARGMLHVDYWTQASLQQYPDGAVMTPYIGSHDTSRFLSLQSQPDRANNKWDNLPFAPDSDEAYDRMYVALAWMLAIPGAPLLYYGDEHGEFGGADPDNRHVMRFEDGLSPRESRQLARVRALGRARQDLPGLRRGPYRPLLVTEAIWAVGRGTGDDLVIAIVNRGAAAESATIPIPTDVAAEGRTFTDALGGPIGVTVERASIQITVPARSAVYLR
jgi:glycosidase